MTSSNVPSPRLRYRAFVSELVAKVDIVVAIAVEVADRHAAAVVVEIDLERLALFVGQEVHPPGDADLRGAFQKRPAPSVHRWPDLEYDPASNQGEANHDGTDQQETPARGIPGSHEQLQIVV